MDYATGAPQTGVRKLQQRRYAVSAEYIVNDWTFRSEYDILQEKLLQSRL